MPLGAAGGRVEQLAALTRIVHDAMVAPGLADDLDAAEAAATALSAADRVNLAEMRRVQRHALAVPGDLAEAATRASAACEPVWRDARAANDFSIVVTALGTVIDRQREIGAAKADMFGQPLYDCLLDGFEPGLTEARINPLFDHLAVELPTMIDTALAQQQGPADEGMIQAASTAQHQLVQALLPTLGFDFEKGRLDVSAHPFTGGASGDTRITTRYNEADALTGLMGVLHELGHALYEMNLPVGWRGQPAGRSRGMALHESQSMSIEVVGRSRAFLTHVLAQMQTAFGPVAATADALFRRANRVERGFIRVDADALSYPLHVILRTRLEQALMTGQLRAPDLPSAWNEGFQALFGLVPPDDARGCMQDIHWYDGAFGYFPTYTLGALGAAQLAAAAFAAQRATGHDPDALLAAGQLGWFIDWMRIHVHERASLADADTIMTEATGRPLDTEAWLALVKSRIAADG
jgi:carboxypeptidase Taq